MRRLRKLSSLDAEGLSASLPRRGHPTSSGGPEARNVRFDDSPISAKRERELVVATEGGDKEACRKLIDSFLPAIRGLARRFAANSGVQQNELTQEGIVGLLFAVRRYDPRLGTPFWAYASFWVRKAIRACSPS